MNDGYGGREANRARPLLQTRGQPIPFARADSRSQPPGGHVGQPHGDRVSSRSVLCAGASWTNVAGVTPIHAEAVARRRPSCRGGGQARSRQSALPPSDRPLRLHRRGGRGAQRSWVGSASAPASSCGPRTARRRRRHGPGRSPPTGRPASRSGGRARLVAAERNYRTGRVLATLVSWRGLADRRSGRRDGAAGAGGRPADAAERPALCPTLCHVAGARRGGRGGGRAARSPASPSCSGARWRARCSTRPTPRASWSPSSAPSRPAIRTEAESDSIRSGRPWAPQPLRRCSSRRGMISTKLQGRWRLSSCHLRISFHASLQAPGEPGRQKM